ncbi:MAG: hypothetical protein K2Y29_17360 [Beijerinckiaceae bacterium]|nr:hypothetical protein [Beijerinckiaceae bacterium]
MGTRGRIDVPTLEKEQLRDLLVAVSDVIITLNDDYVILGVTDPMAIDNLTLWKWTGRTLAEIVATDSVPKISRMLRDESSGLGVSARWRHINFLDAANKNLPLLVKYFQVNAGARTTRLLVCRDLRPVQDAQIKFQQALADLDARAESDRRAMHLSQEPPADLSDLIGRKPFDEIVLEATQILERAFFSEALKRTGGDTAAAARLLKMPLQDFLERLANAGA